MLRPQRASIVNEVQSSYNDVGQLVAEYQEHGGAVNTSKSLKVQYAYEDGTDNNVRLTKMTYPDGRELNYDYGSAGSAGDALSRVSSLIDDDGSTHLVDYSYLGRNTFVQTDYPEPDLRYDLAMGAGDDPYDGFDRFGRIVDSRWYDYGSSADADRILYGYDRAGNRTYREQTCDANSYHDEVYGYDGISRLTDFDRGTINGNKDAISTLRFAQQWSLDPTGNWSAFKEDDDGDSSWDLEQSRTSNEVNEITNITETSGPAWATPAYNRAGNMTTIPKPADPTASFDATYDAWNRLVKLEEGEDTVAEYVYDGAKRRVVKKTYDSGELDETRHFYYTDPQKWQVLEERLESSGVISANPNRQFVWGLRYIDAFVLRDRDTDSNGSLDERLYALQDANWNVTALADTSGDVQERYAYSAYGMPRVLTPTFTTRATSNYDIEVLYAGYRFEQATGLYHVRHRICQPHLGCWVQRDAIDYASGDLHLYRYSLSDPTGSTDPSGLDRVVIAVEGFGAKIKISDNFVKYEAPIGQVVADKVTEENWHHFFQIDEAKAKKKIIEQAKMNFGQVGAPCYHTIILVGFSMGGHVVHKLAHDLEKEGIAVDLVLTLDPIPQVPIPKLDPKYSKSPNVHRWVNYYQRVFWKALAQGRGSVLLGWSVQGADVDTELTETSKKEEWELVFEGVRDPNDPTRWTHDPVEGLRKLFLSGNPTSAHTSIPRHADVLRTFRESVSELPEWRRTFSFEKK